ncbi:hypothetical protein D3C84_582360 [compost metagenome]
MSGNIREFEISLSVFLGEFCQFLIVALAITVEAQSRAVIEHGDQGYLRVNVLQTVLAKEPQLIVADQRVRLDKDMTNAVLIMFEAWHRELACDYTAAKPGVTFKYQDFFAGCCQIRSGHQAVMAGANGYNVVSRGHAWFLLFLSNRMSSRCDKQSDQAPIHG